MKIIIDKISNFFIEGLEYKTPQQCIAVKNGVEILLLNLPKTVLLFLIAYWLNMLFPVIVCMCAYGALRMYSFGIHLSHDISCAAWGFLIYIGGTYFALHINISCYKNSDICNMFFVVIKICTRRYEAKTDWSKTIYSIKSNDNIDIDDINCCFYCITNIS